MSAKTEPSSPISDGTKPSTPPKQKRKPGNATPSSSAKKSNSSPTTNSMTPDIKEALINHMMRIACSAVQKDQLAAVLGITKKQLDDAICSGRINLRSKLVKAARDL